MNNYDYLMRSLMFVPAHNERLMESAATRCNADVLLLDIEDVVAKIMEVSRSSVLLNLLEVSQIVGGADRGAVSR